MNTDTGEEREREIKHLEWCLREMNSLKEKEYIKKEIARLKAGGEVQGPPECFLTICVDGPNKAGVKKIW